MARKRHPTIHWSNATRFCHWTRRKIDRSPAPVTAELNFACVPATLRRRHSCFRVEYRGPSFFFFTDDRPHGYGEQLKWMTETFDANQQRCNSGARPTTDCSDGENTPEKTWFSSTLRASVRSTHERHIRKYSHRYMNVCTPHSFYFIRCRHRRRSSSHGVYKWCVYRHFF